MTFWGSTAVGIDRLAAFRDVDVLCFDHGNEREMQTLMATRSGRQCRSSASSACARQRYGSTARRCRPCILPACWTMHWEARHEHAYGPFPDVTVSAHFSGCPALTGFNLTTALPRDQWAAAFSAPDIDNIQQMLFHYSLLPRLAISRWSGRDWDWWAYCFSRCYVTRWRSRPRWAWRRGSVGDHRHHSLDPAGSVNLAVCRAGRRMRGRCAGLGVARENVSRRSR